MVEYDNLAEETLEYVRDLLRNDTTLCVTILGLSGTSSSVNSIFIGRPRNERLNKNSKPIFKLPRITIDLIDNPRAYMGNNEDGWKQSSVDLQISHWAKNTTWSKAFKVNDRICKLLEQDKMPVSNSSSYGFSRFDVTSAEVIDDPDRSDTKLGRIRVKTLVQSA